MRCRFQLLDWSGTIALCVVPAAAPALPPESAAAAARTRLSHAYLRLEGLWRDRPPRTDDEVARANRAFDAASLALFAGRFAPAIATVDSHAITRGAVVVSPSTTVYMRTAGALEALLAAVARERTIDRARAVVIGHSMGAGAARNAGVRLTFQRREHYGHTLLVGDALPQVMDWLWEQISH